MRRYVAYGPRWIDYEGWGNLELGMSKKDVLSIMGEPYLPQQSYLHTDSTIEVLAFKIRTKYYPLRERSKVILQNDVGKETISYTEKESKPAKYANTEVWGNCVDLLCFFENRKLIRWYCPQILNVDSIQTIIDIVPLKIEKNKFATLPPSESKSQVVNEAVTDTSINIVPLRIEKNKFTTLPSSESKSQVVNEAVADTSIDIVPLKIEKNKLATLPPSESKSQVVYKAVADTSLATSDLSSLKSYFYPIEKRRYVRIVTDAGYTFEVFLIGETPSNYLIAKVKDPSSNVASFKKEKASSISDIK